MLVCKRVTKTWDGRTVLKDVTLRIDPGECVSIVGGAGSGKTTLLRLLLNADEPTSGSIEVDGVPLANLPPLILQLYRSRLGVTFQEPRLLRSATVAENIAFPLELRSATSSTIQRRCEELMGRLGLTAKADLLPGALSVSDRALTGIARAFSASPLIVLADEPVQLLDEPQGRAVLDLFSEAHRHGTTIIVLTGNAAITEALAARTLTLKDGTIFEPSKGNTLGRAPMRHRILETDVEPSPKPPDGEGRKIKITAIHS